jgi:predicted O-linked N-acetylglucosamine transferase (SPINDLY family)
MAEAVAAHQRGQVARAQAMYRQILESEPDNPDALHLLGVTCTQSGEFEAALEYIDRAIALRPGDAACHSNRGKALAGLGRAADALASYDRAVALAPGYAEAHNNRGNALRALKRAADALASYDRAIAIAPGYAEAFGNRGNALMDLRRPEEALASYDRALGLKPGLASAHANRGVALLESRHLAGALASFDHAIRLAPGNAEAHANRALVLLRLGRPGDALAACDAALGLNPGHATALAHRGLVLQQLGRMEEAAACYGRAVALRPDAAFLYGTWLHACMKVCDWSRWESSVAEMLGMLEAGLPVAPPFALLAVTDSAARQRRAAEILVQSRFPAVPEPRTPDRRPRTERLRLGYFSADFHDHPTMYLMAELFERHDRDRFELMAFSFGPDRRDAMRRRVETAFDRFLDVRDRSDGEIAALARELEVDIAVDLKGFTQDHRIGIFAHRASSLQVGYLGYPGTTGAGYLDYLIADRVLIPDASQRHYSEKIVYLPGCYQVNDRRRPAADAPLDRRDLGLPGSGFVFCCFNNSYKITPPVFDGWMRILGEVRDSVLWLFAENSAVARNLRREAGARGIDPARLVFAAPLPQPEHLARHAAADLFLDTTPCNAHTTASDALWCGLPLLTQAGESFASRVAASLLQDLGLPELVTHSQPEYERTAVALAGDAQRLARIRGSLAEGRLAAPLFDAGRFAGTIESAYLEIHARWLRGEPPAHLYL